MLSLIYGGYFDHPRSERVETVEGKTHAAESLLALIIKSNPDLQTTFSADIPERIC